MNRIESLKLFLSNPRKIIKDGLKAQAENIHKENVKAKYGIDQLPTINILDLLPDLKESIDNYSFLGGTSLITDLILLKALARTYDNCSYLEIGSWRGESITNVADVAKECHSITLSADEMRSRNWGDEFVRAHGVFLKGKTNISTIEHDSQTYDFSKLNKKFDLIFVDGDHTYRGVLADTKNTFSLRKNEKSIIVWHDYGNGTEDIRHSVLQGILDGIPRDKHKNLYHVSNTMCAVYIEGRKFDTTFTKFPTYPDKKFSIHLQSERM